jgi:hypothetical protein
MPLFPPTGAVPGDNMPHLTTILSLGTLALALVTTGSLSAQEVTSKNNRNKDVSVVNQAQASNISTSLLVDLGAIDAHLNLLRTCGSRTPPAYANFNTNTCVNP